MENSVDIPLKTHPTGTEDKIQGKKNRLVKGREKFLWYTNVHWHALELFRITKSCGEEKSRPTNRRTSQASLGSPRPRQEAAAEAKGAERQPQPVSGQSHCARSTRYPGADEGRGVCVRAPGSYRSRHHRRRPQPGKPAAEASGGSAAVSRRRSWLPAPKSLRFVPMQTPARCKRAITFPKRMRYGGGLRDEAVPLRLANYPLVITCFRCCLVAHGSEPPPQGKPTATRQQHGAKQKPRLAARRSATFADAGHAAQDEVGCSLALSSSESFGKADFGRQGEEDL